MPDRPGHPFPEEPATGATRPPRGVDPRRDGAGSTPGSGRAVAGGAAAGAATGATAAATRPAAASTTTSAPTSPVAVSGSSTTGSRPVTRDRRKTPLAWLPWALLAGIALLLLLSLLAWRAVGGDDGATGTGDTAAQGEQGGTGSGDPAPGTGEGQGGTEGAGPGTGALDPCMLCGLSEQAVVGGGTVPFGPAAQTAQAGDVAQQPGTTGVVLFAEGSAEIDDAGRQVVEQSAQTLREAGAQRIEVVGHTDQLAGDPVNAPLSQERADNVAAALSELLPGVEITTSSQAADQPVASNEAEEGRQLNRRAEILARG
jgi:outer membrane protein OmpA-like peptidoglycan-associated protein